MKPQLSEFTANETIFHYKVNETEITQHEHHLENVMKIHYCFAGYI